MHCRKIQIARQNSTSKKSKSLSLLLHRGHCDTQNMSVFPGEPHSNFIVENFKEMYLLPVPVISRLKSQSPTSPTFYFVCPSVPASLTLFSGVPNTGWYGASHQPTNTLCQGFQGPRCRQTLSPHLGKFLMLPGHQQVNDNGTEHPSFNCFLLKSKHKWTSRLGITELIRVSRLKQMKSGKL